MDGYIDISNSSHSEVWKYFLKNKVQNRAKCNQCNQIYEIKSGSTTNLRSHLRTRHNVELISAKKFMDVTHWNSYFLFKVNFFYVKSNVCETTSHQKQSKEIQSNIVLKISDVSGTRISGFSGTLTLKQNYQIINQLSCKLPDPSLISMYILF